MPKQLADKFTFRYDALIDEIVGNCDGDLHGAIKALLLVNEQLEQELNRALGLPTFSLGAKRTLH